jgi:hypothetical protein
MFIRYEFDKTQVSNSTAGDAVMSDLFQAINGTITDPANFTSGYCNKELSEIHGSVSWGTTATDLYQPVYNSGNDFRFRKYHHNRDDAASYNPASIVGLYWDAHSDRPHFDMKTSSDNYVLSSANNRGTYWTADSGSSQPPGGIHNGYDRVLIFASAYWFVIQIYQGDRLMTGGVFDFEDSAADTYAYGLNTDTSPQMFFANDVQDMRSGQDSHQSIYWGRSHYMTVSGNIETNDTQRNEAGFTGGTITYTNYVPSLFPAPMIPQSPGKITSGDGHFLTPVFVIPTRGGSDLSMSSFGKIPYLYRTTDDLAQGGDLITYNTIDYMSLPMHKTGGDNIGSQPLVANYLVPKLIGGV